VKRAALLALALIACGAGALAQETRVAETRADDFVYQIPAEGISLEMLAHDAEVATGRTFILSDKSPLRGKMIRLVGEARVPRDQVMMLFQALFVTQGYALKPLGEATNRILVVESVDTALDLKQRAVFVSPADLDAHRHEVGTVVMTFFPLKHVKVANVRAALAPILVSKTVELVLDVESANALLAFGFAPTMFAIKQLIGAMDVPQPDSDVRFELLTLVHGVAEEIEPVVTDLVQANGSSGGAAAKRGGALGAGAEKPSPRIVADPRLNAIAVYAVSSDVEEIRTLVRMLDLESKDPAQNLRIYRLKHTNAEDIADVLSQSISGGGSGGSRGGGGSEKGGDAGAPGFGGAQPSRGSGSPTAGAQGDILIVAEPHNNALLIRCSRTRYDEIRPLIDELDRQRPQVIIQAAVAELTDDQLQSIGTEIAAFQGGDGWRAGAVTGFGISQIDISSSLPISGSGTGSGTGTGGGMGGPSQHAPAGHPSIQRLPIFPGNPISNRGGIFGLFNDQLNVPLLIQLLQNKQRGNLVSMPVVIANDNSQSMIEAGLQIATVGFTAGGASTTTTGGFEGGGLPPAVSGATGDQFAFSGYQEAKVSLTISPHISNDNYVRLEVELLVEAFVGPRTESRATNPPDKTSRKLVGSVTIREGSTVVVGGLTLDQDNSDLRGVPPFADAPIVGPLMSLRATNRTRSTIYFFLTPTIISTFETLDHVSYAKKLEIQKLQGPVRIIDPNFRPVLLDSHRIAIDQIEASGNLDLPRYIAIVPIEECRPTTPPPQELPGGSRSER
jgi:general secretion pathway protein D